MPESALTVNKYKKTLYEGDRIKVCFRDLVPEIPSTTFGSFGLYRYPAKFIPQVVAYVLNTYKKPDITILDPFAGCGTVGLVSRMYGFNYELWDLNPMLEILHRIAIMKPPKNIDVEELVSKITSYRKQFIPSWSKLSYWFPEEVLSYLANAWGFYHQLEDKEIQQLILIPLLKTTRLFSYNDEQRQKLSQSPIARKRVNTLLKGNWKFTFSQVILREIETAIRKLNEYQMLLFGQDMPQSVIRAGVDAIDFTRRNNIKNKWDFLITSPPYLQAQEYIRNSKLDLFWLGYSEDIIKQLSQNELPYRDVNSIPIYSHSYFRYRGVIKELHLKKMYDRYFNGVLGVLTSLASGVSQYLFLFVGPASVRSIRIPIDRIFIEHFTNLGWLHEATLVDLIPSRVMFRSSKNPATGLKDDRIRTECLVILRKNK
jgi:hypothetical protein